MKLKTRKLVMSTLVGSIATAVAGLAVADVTIRLRPSHNFVVEDFDDRVDNFIVKDQGNGVEVPRGPLDIKNTTSGGKAKFYEGSGGGGNSVTVKSPDALAADVIFTLPDTEGGGEQLLQTDGSGVLSWVGSTGTGCDSSEEIVDLTVPAARGGRTWMDRNLGASRRATDSNDGASYGGLFQWGRGRDGHECSWRAKYPGKVGSSAVGGNLWDGQFVHGAQDYTDWLSPSNNILWGDGSIFGTSKGVNDPCPTGYQIPNRDELAALKITGTSDAFELLKLPTNGVRDGTYRIHFVGGGGYYWSSSAVPNNEQAYTLDIDNASKAGIQSNSGRNYGYAVRCIKSL